MEHFAKWSVVLLMSWATIRWTYVLIKTSPVRHAGAFTVGVAMNVWIIVAVMVWWQP